MNDNCPPLPNEVVKWLSTLPPNAYLKEVMIAERNWKRIYDHLNKDK